MYRGSTHYSPLSQGQTCVNAFSPLSPPTPHPHPQSAPSAFFSADCGLWQSYLPFNPDQSPSHSELRNHKHFISSDLTLIQGVMSWGGGGLHTRTVGTIAMSVPSRHVRHLRAPSLVRAYMKHVCDICLCVCVCIIHKEPHSSQ